MRPLFHAIGRALKPNPRRSRSPERPEPIADARRRVPEVADAIETVLKEQGRVTFRVYGGSMMPTVWPGCRVEVVRCSLEDVRRGDLVLVRSGDRLLLHRVVRLSGGAGTRTRGDRQLGEATLTAPSDLMGRVPGLVVGHFHWHQVPRRRANAVRQIYAKALPILGAGWRLARRLTNAALRARSATR